MKFIVIIIVAMFAAGKLNAQVIELTDLNTNTVIRSGDTAWITGDSPPKIPRLQASLKNGDARKWKLSVKYDGHLVTLTPRKSLIPFTPWRLPTTTEEEDGFFGGDAELQCEQSNGKTIILKFSIYGKNPSDAECKRYINPRRSAPWYAYAIAKHESKDQNGPGSRYNQFYDKNGKKPGYPVKSPDNGYGIMQLTDKPVTLHQKWNWQANIDGGVKKLSEKIDDAEDWMKGERARAKKSVGKVVKVPNEKVGTITFSDNDPSRPIENAVAIKNYNGSSNPPGISGNGRYCVWNANNKQWEFRRVNNLKFNYVERICAEVD